MALSTEALAAATAKKLGLGPISATEVYPLAVFSQLTGMNRYAIRNARRRGLVVKKIGVRSFVSGKSWLDFVNAAD